MDKDKVLVDDVTKMQADALSMTELPKDVADKIRVRYFELAKKYPHMKRHRLMRKAGEEFHVIFKFEK